MRRVLIVTVVLVTALVPSACGGDSSSPSGPVTSYEGSIDTPTEPTGSSATAAAADLDCAALNKAASELIAPVQLMVQLTTVDAFEQVKAGTLGSLDIDAFLAAITTLHALDHVGSPLGDPKAALDAYEAAGTQVKTLFASPSVTQPQLDTYLASLGTVQAFLDHQGAVSGALATAGC